MDHRITTTTDLIPITQILQTRGLRPSPQRVAVFTYLCNNDTHPTVEMVYSALLPDYPTLSRTTVYQTLEALCECGLATKITIEDGEMRFDSHMQEHGHFKCEKCRSITNIMSDGSTIQLPKPPEGFAVKETHIYYKGICPNCLSNT